MYPNRIQYLFLVLLLASLQPDLAGGQVIMLPSFRSFSVRTAVSVPHAGTTKLGGIHRSAMGSIQRGGLVPRPLGNNHAFGSVSNSALAGVSAQVIIMEEYEQALVAEAARRRKYAAAVDPNGPASTQRKADFITRHIGRSTKR